MAQAASIYHADGQYLMVIDGTMPLSYAPVMFDGNHVSLDVFLLDDGETYPLHLNPNTNTYTRMSPVPISGTMTDQHRDIVAAAREGVEAYRALKALQSAVTNLNLDAPLESEMTETAHNTPALTITLDERNEFEITYADGQCQWQAVHIMDSGCGEFTDGSGTCNTVLDAVRDWATAQATS